MEPSAVTATTTAWTLLLGGCWWCFLLLAASAEHDMSRASGEAAAAPVVMTRKLSNVLYHILSEGDKEQLKRYYQFGGVGKRRNIVPPDDLYTFGLGKRGEEDAADSGAEDSWRPPPGPGEHSRIPRSESLYYFGLGKRPGSWSGSVEETFLRPSVHPEGGRGEEVYFAAPGTIPSRDGEGNWDSQDDARWSIGLDERGYPIPILLQSGVKRTPQIYHFGLGKRLRGSRENELYYFGIGKRTEDPEGNLRRESRQKSMFHFGLGKREAPRYSVVKRNGVRGTPACRRGPQEDVAAAEEIWEGKVTSVPRLGMPEVPGTLASGGGSKRSSSSASGVSVPLELLEARDHARHPEKSPAPTQ